MTLKETALPVLELEGSPYEQGLAHGRFARELIAQNLKIYFYRFERETKLPKAEVLRRAGLYLRVIEQCAPQYAEAMRGVAEGARIGLLEIAALNARYELIYSEETRKALEHSDGCTSFVVLPQKSSNGHLLLAENWDWIPDIQCLILKIREPGVPEILCFTEAGIVGGKIGLNAAGLGLAINGLNSEKDNWALLAKPFHVRCWEILRCTDFEQALRVVTEGERSVSANFLIAQAPDRALDLETAPTGVSRLLPRDGWLAHTNHFIDLRSAGLTRNIHTSKRPSTEQRLARAATSTSYKFSAQLGKSLRNLARPRRLPLLDLSPSRREVPPEERYQSVVSVVMDLTEKSLAIASGPPCQHEYRTLKL
jgi:isopenicillin-N N-acyltransferase-like protein